MAQAVDGSFIDQGLFHSFHRDRRRATLEGEPNPTGPFSFASLATSGQLPATQES